MVECRLSATLLILNLQSTYGVPNAHTDAIFSLLSGKLLPMPNTLPKSRQEAKQVLASIGMVYNIIHACPNGCVLFRKDLENATECPKCEAKRYRDDMIGTKVPEKVCIKITSHLTKMTYNEYRICIYFNNIYLYVISCRYI